MLNQQHTSLGQQRIPSKCLTLQSFWIISKLTLYSGKLSARCIQYSSLVLSCCDMLDTNQFVIHFVLAGVLQLVSISLSPKNSCKLSLSMRFTGTMKITSPPPQHHIVKDVVHPKMKPVVSLSTKHFCNFRVIHCNIFLS